MSRTTGNKFFFLFLIFFFFSGFFLFYFFWIFPFSIFLDFYFLYFFFLFCFVLFWGFFFHFSTWTYSLLPVKLIFIFHLDLLSIASQSHFPLSFPHLDLLSIASSSNFYSPELTSDCQFFIFHSLHFFFTYLDLPPSASLVMF